LIRAHIYGDEAYTGQWGYGNLIMEFDDTDFGVTSAFDGTDSKWIIDLSDSVTASVWVDDPVTGSGTVTDPLDILSSIAGYGLSMTTNIMDINTGDGLYIDGSDNLAVGWGDGAGHKLYFDTDTLDSDRTFTWNDPVADGYLKTDASGNLSFDTGGAAQNIWYTLTSDDGGTNAPSTTGNVGFVGGNGIVTSHAAGTPPVDLNISIALDPDPRVSTVTVETVTTGNMYMLEQANADGDIAGYGQLWVKTATPDELYFTDDAGTDFPLNAADDTGGYTIQFYYDGSLQGTGTRQLIFDNGYPVPTSGEISKVGVWVPSWTQVDAIDTLQIKVYYGVPGSLSSFTNGLTHTGRDDAMENVAPGSSAMVTGGSHIIKAEIITTENEGPDIITDCAITVWIEET